MYCANVQHKEKRLAKESFKLGGSCYEPRPITKAEIAKYSGFSVCIQRALPPHSLTHLDHKALLNEPENRLLELRYGQIPEHTLSELPLECILLALLQVLALGG